MRAHPFGAILLLLLAGCESRPRVPATGILSKDVARPDVVLVVMDTLRPDHLEAYGYPRPTSPFLRAVAERSTVFEDALSSSSWTAPSVASIMTGLYPMRHGITQGFRAHRHEMADVVRRGETPTRVNSLAETTPTLSERLAAVGYRTFGIATNINVGPETALSRGLEHFVPIDFRRSRRPSDGRLWYGPAEDVRAVFEEWRELRSEAGPTFVYLHFNDAHEPYLSRGEPSDAHEDAEIAAYDSEIRHVDDTLAAMLEPLGKNTFLIVVSDHGEAFDEHGYRRHPAALHRELNRVAFMATGPGIQPARRHARVSLVDIAPTVLELVGAEAPPDLDGLSLATLLSGAPSESLLRALQSRPVFAHRRLDESAEIFAVSQGHYKLIAGPDGRELYDLDEDPFERRNIESTSAAICGRLASRFTDYQREHGESNSGVTAVPMSEADLDRLRSLGYVE